MATPDSPISKPPAPILPPQPGQPPPTTPTPAVLFPATLEACHAEITRLLQLQAEADDMLNGYKDLLAGPMVDILAYRAEKGIQ